MYYNFNRLNEAVTTLKNVTKSFYRGDFTDILWQATKPLRPETWIQRGTKISFCNKFHRKISKLILRWWNPAIFCPWAVTLASPPGFKSAFFLNLLRTMLLFIYISSSVSWQLNIEAFSEPSQKAKIQHFCKNSS